MATVKTVPPVLGAPVPVMDLAAYEQVIIVKSDTVGGHTYKRGQTTMADAATRQEMLTKGMINGSPAA